MNEESLNISQESKEKEEKPQKIFLIIRHPETAKFGVLEKHGDGKILSREGLKNVRLLSGYLKANLAGYLKEVAGENESLDGKYKVWTSPIKRARSEAEIIMKNIKLSHTENPGIPLPANNEPIINKGLEEIDTRNPDRSLGSQANDHGERIKTFTTAFNKRLPDIKRTLNELMLSETPVNIIFTHRATCAVLLWLIERFKEAADKEALQGEEVEEVIKIWEKIKHNSISEIRQLSNGGWKIMEIGKTSYLK